MIKRKEKELEDEDEDEGECYERKKSLVETGRYTEINSKGTTNE